MPKQQASVLRYCSSLQILLFYMYYTDQEAEKAILVGVALQSEGITYEQMTEYLDELSFLAETAGAETVKIFTQNLDKPVHATFIGKGKLEEIKAYTEENPVDMVIFDDALSPTQLRNIESVFPGIKVLDRTNLILDIFASRARTAHAKTQVELAEDPVFTSASDRNVDTSGETKRRYRIKEDREKRKSRPTAGSSGIKSAV